MRVIEGVVKKISNANTAIVEVERLVSHKIYGKVMKRTTKFKVDFRETDLKIGDKVRIREVRPISKDKHFEVHQEQKTAKRAPGKDKK